MRFRNLYRGSRVELFPESLNAFELLHDLKGSVCQVYGLSVAQLNFSVRDYGAWVGDCEKIRMILLELLNNAACSSDQGQASLSIGLFVQIQPDVVNLEVTDNGRGIAIPLHQRVFRMFERNESGAGNGMGLFIVRETVKQLGGDIRLKSEVGKGSVFQVRIPNLLSQQHRFAV
jgi:signal transduction histidine kinase